MRLSLSPKCLALLACLAVAALATASEAARRSPCGPGVPADINGNCSPRRTPPADTEPRREAQPAKPRVKGGRRCPPGMVTYLGTCTPKCAAGVVNTCKR